MHFLDKIFPLQYLMYAPEILEGGRSWLLALLFRTKPLYHAALALSSYHRRMMIITKIPHPCRVVAMVQQEQRDLLDGIAIGYEIGQPVCPDKPAK
jgi:C6 transcription factor Pro1